MSLRHKLRRTALALLPLLAAAACNDESPTLEGDEFFPGGTRPVTREIFVPAVDVVEPLGVFNGYTEPGDFLFFSSGFLLVANQYGGELTANSLVRFLPAPTSFTYAQNGQSQTASEFTFSTGRLVARVDTGATPNTGPVTLRVWELTQDYDPNTVTWTLASDTAGPVAWTQPGGTRGAVLAEATFTRGTTGDSLVFALDSLTVRRIADTASLGVVVTAQQPGSRVQLNSVVLRTGVHPAGAARDTVLATDLRIDTGSSTFVFTPEPPAPSGAAFEVGGARASRTLFRLDLDQRVPVCPATGPCTTVPLGEVTLNRVALVLRPIAVTGGFAALDTVPLTLRAVDEPELGRRAPLGQNVLDVFDDTGPVARFAPGDTEVEIPITGYTRAVAGGDTLTTAFALLSEPTLSTFGIVRFEPTPRLRIVYTVPVRPQLP